MSTQKRPDLDALLRAWPALGGDDRPLPAEGDLAWDERADAIVAAARGATKDATAVAAAMAAPSLPAEPGEPRINVRSASHSGELQMSSESEGGPKSGVPTSGAPASLPRPRQSLREMAERASRPGATPLPGRASSPAISTPVPGRASAPAGSTPIPSAPAVKRAAEGGAADSGIVDLNIVKATADAQMIAAAAKAKPAEASLFDDDAEAKPASGAAAAKAKDGKAVVATRAKPAPKSGSGATAGIVIALVGLAAAFGIWQMRKSSGSADAERDAAKPAVTAAAEKPAAGADDKAAPSAVAAAPGTAAGDQGLDPSALPDEQRAAAAARGAPARVGGPLPRDVKSAEPVAAAEPAKKGSQVGDLKSEMQKAVGADGKPLKNEGEPEAAENVRSKTLPERPSQGAVQAAIGQVLGGAKACVSDADEATRATVTFNSTGAVANVTVTGWASANGKSGCVVAALKGAKVGAFTDASYSFPVSIRP